MYLTLPTPDDLIICLYGPEVGSRQDKSLYRQSGLEDELQKSQVIDGIQYYIYGDPAFVLRPCIQLVFNRAFETPKELKFNSSMISALEAVEWSYRDTKQQFAALDYKRIL